MKRNTLRLIVLLAIAMLLPAQVPAQPEISSISAESGMAVTAVTLTGRQFTSDNAIQLGGK